MTTAFASILGNDKLLIFLAGLGLLALFFWFFATDYERKKRNIGTIIVLTIGIFSILSIFPKEQWGDVISGKTPIGEAHNLKGGIDLVGGSSFTLRVQPGKDDSGNPIPVTAESLEHVKSIIEKRLNSIGLADMQVVSQGVDRILVQISGIDQESAEKAKKILEKIVRLEIKLVHPENDLLVRRVLADPENEIIPGYKVYDLENKRDGEITKEKILLNKFNLMDGSYVVHAQALHAPYEGTLEVTLNGDGGKKMFDATSKMNIGRDRMAIVLDGKCLSAPTVNAVLSKKFIIEGMDNLKEAQILAAALRNPLKNPLEVIQESTVSATLGQKTINQGVTAGIAGLALTLVFVLLYYRFAGLIALFGLVLNILILFGVMAMFGATFTLPGIAGIILTIGVAVDANVLVYERLREELASGKSVRAAIGAAYDKAFSAIFDANITTLLTALILFWRASGTVKGFAVTLTIGILATLITALLCTRVLFWWFSDAGWIKKLSFMNLIPKKAFNFLGLRKLAFTLSAILILAGISTIGIKGDSALGISFTGGSEISFQLKQGQSIDQPEAQAVIDELTLKQDASSQEVTDAAGLHTLSVRCAEKDIPTIEKALRDHFAILGETEEGSETPAISMDTETVSATLGKEFLTTAVWALFIGLIAILIYITVRFEFSFAIGAFFALFHDILICLGIVILAGQQLSLIHVGAFLTIAGYSINDTIVVFDRIREDLKTKRGNVKDVMNTAINSTLSRTVLTSVTTFVAVLVLFIFGGTALKDFSFTIMVGVVVGTYSSIFIASPIVYIWSKMRGANLRRELLDANLEAEVNPAKG